MHVGFVYRQNTRRVCQQTNINQSLLTDRTHTQFVYRQNIIMQSLLTDRKHVEFAYRQTTRRVCLHTEHMQSLLIDKLHVEFAYTQISSRISKHLGRIFPILGNIQSAICVHVFYPRNENIIKLASIKPEVASVNEYSNIILIRNSPQSEILQEYRYPKQIDCLHMFCKTHVNSNISQKMQSHYNVKSIRWMRDTSTSQYNAYKKYKMDEGYINIPI